MNPSDLVSTAVVVVTAMPLSTAARADLSEILGSGYIVIDIKKAPSTANILLTPVVSSQLLGSLRALFPSARVLFTELHDDGRGIRFSGPLSRIVEQGPDGYFVAHALEALAPIVHSEAELQLAGSTRRTPPRIAASPQAAPTEPGVDQVDRDGPASPGVAIIWIDRAESLTVPPGRWLDLDPIDHLVERLISTTEPRGDILWATIVAECAVRLIAQQQDNVLVDVGLLAPAITAELQIRVASESVVQLAWPSS